MGYSIQEVIENASELASSVKHGDCLTLYRYSPSGKYYLPFACSNVTPCEHCHGTGNLKSQLPKRLTKKREKYMHTYFHKMSKRFGKFPLSWPIEKQAQWKHVRSLATVTSRECDVCNGVGSREAMLDEIWNETLEEALGELGFYMEGSEGDESVLFYKCGERRFESVKECEDHGSHLENYDSEGYCDLCWYNEEGEEK